MDEEVTWRKAQRSNDNGGNCIEVATPPGEVWVRDSKDPAGPRLSVTPEQWKAFLSALR